jgi:predicted aspartyl protease
MTRPQPDARLAMLAMLAMLLGLSCGDMQGVSSSAASADSAAGEVAFRLAGPGGAALVVPAYINGHGPVDLILDTGATLTCVDTAFARTLALPERRFTIGMAAGIGGSGRVSLHSVDSLRVGAAVVRALTVCAIDLRELRVLGGGVRGLLGLNVLRNFRVTLDFERRVVRLAPPGG